MEEDQALTCEQDYEIQTYEGFLCKQSPSVVRSWQRRWFSLKGCELKYFKSNLDVSEEACLGTIETGTIQSARGSTSTGCSKFPYSLRIITSQRNYLLAADSELSRENWIKAIQEAMRLKGVISSPLRTTLTRYSVVGNALRPEGLGRPASVVHSSSLKEKREQVEQGNNWESKAEAYSESAEKEKIKADAKISEISEDAEKSQKSNNSSQNEPSKEIIGDQTPSSSESENKMGEQPDISADPPAELVEEARRSNSSISGGMRLEDNTETESGGSGSHQSDTSLLYHQPITSDGPAIKQLRQILGIQTPEMEPAISYDSLGSMELLRQFIKTLP